MFGKYILTTAKLVEGHFDYCKACCRTVEVWQDAKKACRGWTNQF